MKQQWGTRKTAAMKQRRGPVRGAQLSCNCSAGACADCSNEEADRDKKPIEPHEERTEVQAVSTEAAHWRILLAYAACATTCGAGVIGAAALGLGDGALIPIWLTVVFGCTALIKSGAAVKSARSLRYYPVLIIAWYFIVAAALPLIAAVIVCLIPSASKQIVNLLPGYYRYGGFVALGCSFATIARAWRVLCHGGPVQYLGCGAHVHQLPTSEDGSQRSITARKSSTE